MWNKPPPRRPAQGEHRRSSTFHNGRDITVLNLNIHLNIPRSNSATNCCKLFVVETKLFRIKACEVSVCAACISVLVVCTKPRGRRERQSGQSGRSKRKDAWKCAGATDRKCLCHGGSAIDFRRTFPSWVRNRLACRRVRASVCRRWFSDPRRY